MVGNVMVDDGFVSEGILKFCQYLIKLWQQLDDQFLDQPVYLTILYDNALNSILKVVIYNYYTLKPLRAFQLGKLWPRRVKLYDSLQYDEQVFLYKLVNYLMPGNFAILYLQIRSISVWPFCVKSLADM